MMPIEPNTNLHLRQRALQEEMRELMDVVGPASLVELLVERSFHLRATDIHLDPVEDGLRIRIRVDGILHTILTVPSSAAGQMLSRLKLLAGMDITERRTPQDGHLTHTFTEAPRDVRVASGPSLLGERLVLRLMPEPEGFQQLEHLGLEPDQFHTLSQCSRHPYGLIVAAGPVGSGKTSTVYGCLAIANAPSKSVLTIEDPVERRIAGVTQIQVDTRISFGFPIAARAARAGILVFSTLHARDATAAIDVFRDFGVPPMFLADSLTAVVAERLIRKVCPHCRVERPATPAELEFLSSHGPISDQQSVSEAKGCEQCFHTGYSGRTGVFEIQTFDDEFRRLILSGADREQIVERARRRGMISLRSAAARKVLAGVTTLEEVHRLLLTELD